MDGFFEFMDVSFFSCDTNRSSLILSEKNGTIQSISDSIGSLTPDHFKKHIRFYPIDDSSYTTTDNGIGLRVWDRVKEREVYRYLQDSLGIHEYSPNCVLGCVSTTGIKLYDLRCRYHISSCGISLPLGLKWDCENLYAFNESEIFKYNLKKDSLDLVLSDRNINNLFVNSNELYYTKQSNLKYYLVKQNLNYEIETVGFKGGILKGVVYLYGNNEIKFYGKEGSLKTLGFVKNIEHVVFGDFNTYLFGDRKLYIKEGV